MPTLSQLHSGAHLMVGPTAHFWYQFFDSLVPVVGDPFEEEDREDVGLEATGAAQRVRCAPQGGFELGLADLVRENGAVQDDPWFGVGQSAVIG